MNSNIPALELNNLHKHFARGRGLVKAVENVSFVLPQGEIFGFLGPNGAGKTTTIRCIMNFIRPTSGSIRIFGKDAQKDAVELKQYMGYLSGNIRLYNRWTGKDHINYFSKINGGAEEANYLIERLDFDPTKKTKQLSSGNRQKLGIILALMHNPALIILDEPTNALDPILQQTTHHLLEEARDRGATVFMSSHNLAEVERVCDSVAIIKQGRLVATESISSLQQKHLYTVKAQFDRKLNYDDLRMQNASVEFLGDKRVILHVKGDIVPVLEKLSQLPLRDIEVHHATVEEIFLEYYQS